MKREKGDGGSRNQRVRENKLRIFTGGEAKCAGWKPDALIHGFD